MTTFFVLVYSEKYYRDPSKIHFLSKLPQNWKNKIGMKIIPIVKGINLLRRANFIWATSNFSVLENAKDILMYTND